MWIFFVNRQGFDVSPLFMMEVLIYSVSKNSFKMCRVKFSRHFLIKKLFLGCRMLATMFLNSNTQGPLLCCMMTLSEPIPLEQLVMLFSSLFNSNSHRLNVDL